MYQQGLVDNDDQSQNFFNNQEYMPNPPTDTKDVIAFRRWSAASWVRPMYFFSLIIMALVLIVNFVRFVDTGSAAVIFFGIVLILLCCGACVIFHRIIYELAMAFLQLPKLIAAMERLADTVQKTNSFNSNNNRPAQPIMTTGYQTNDQHQE
mmetsp:Transcript_68535/g.61574  ORF Transcript_68535/g.61574 Transcript_68535/m.61574 type:complete len:152 (-) Transcript_68535:32-487(-)